MLKLHIGCGARLEREWHNIDMEIPSAHHRAAGDDVEVKELDVRRIMPYGAASVDMIYSEHFVEHLTREEGERFFTECFRVLRVGGTMRISTPDLTTVMEVYRQARISSNPSRWTTAELTATGSMAGESRPLPNALLKWAPVGYVPDTACRMVNECLTLWGHRFTYDDDELLGVLSLVGFSKARRMNHGETAVSGMLTEGRPFCGDLIVEAVKG